jgi:hypothetical protein
MYILAAHTSFPLNSRTCKGKTREERKKREEKKTGRYKRIDERQTSYCAVSTHQIERKPAIVCGGIPPGRHGAQLGRKERKGYCICGELRPKKEYWRKKR